MSDNLTGRSVQKHLDRLTARLASNTADLGAAMVGVNDANEYYDGATVEAVLGEVGPVIDYMDDSVDGLHAKRVARITFDPTSDSSLRSTGNHFSTIGLLLNTVITRAWYEVITTFTSANDSATLSIGISSDDEAGIKAAIAISNGGNPWDAGYHECIQDGAATNFANKVTQSGQPIKFIVGTQALTGGKLILFLEYVQA